MMSGFTALHGIVAKAKPPHRLRPHVGDEHIRIWHKRQQRLAVLRILQVQHDAALVAVSLQIKRPHAVGAIADRPSAWNRRRPIPP